MKRIICLSVILLCAATFAFAQGGSGRVTKKKKPVAKKIDSQIAEAEKVWISFWKEFTKAVKNNDNDSFYEMVAEEYDASGLYRNNENCRNFADGRKEFFCLLREQENSLANEFSWVFERRLKLMNIEKSSEKINRFVKYSNDTYRFAEFIYKANGKWYLINSGSGGA
ncbi:MAG TPA: hypothetical protein PKE69_15790 [Pyrinomonadaceae bacterium]|nr:hypothetical protein [Pyrinomonadaceae bacterium]